MNNEVKTTNQFISCVSKMVHFLSNYVIIFIPTNRWIHMYYFKLYLILLIHNVINLLSDYILLI